MTTTGKDNRFIDFAAAVAGGLAVSYYAQSATAFLKRPWSTAEDFQLTAIYAAAYALAAILVLPWGGRLRRDYGWVAVAVIGALFCALADTRLADAGEAARGESLLPVGVVLYSLISLPVIAVVRYLAIVLRDRQRRTVT